ncbi:putative pyridoxal-dependent aspartate 1-decarboxylase [Psychrosphaera ytuae]|uniref:Pyridoxal-dependent aspartate 1-decarboxylase n=1 Tax=Psychrosphaera ytuae TaxID=2820710 RepID=A0A975D8T3_9GAMM|nr:putative pyridoxal-dependent aspartate 1-decarboxylase [Psychrosphaera ytuae]QTH62616.1 putative pyridoxal-dependent aspartate 1-decarboxylase [Psychrosphaera ytuae]
MSKKRFATATEQNLFRIFTIPEAPDSTLAKIEQEVSQNLDGFLRENIVAVEKPLSDIEQDFQESLVPERPQFVSDVADELLHKLVAQSVHTSSPSFIGHMTSALPYFLLPLSKLMVGLNQNLVKIETSKAFTPLERQTIGMLHRIAYGQGRTEAENEAYYDAMMHSADASLGAFCSGGTIANISALWVARNTLLGPQPGFKGVAKEGLFRAMMHYGYKRLVVLVSERGHYSLGKAADVLGMGRQDIVSVGTDENNKIRIDLLEQKIAELKAEGAGILALIGVAGTTETGNIDPLDAMADIAEREGIHFHVDAAWGGATMLSENARPLLKGIERADSITVDAHKQMYVPMGAGMVLFKDPHSTDVIEHHAEYILRKGSKDLGSHTLEGSRPGMSMLVYACLKVMGRSGYQMLIDRSIDTAKYFAELIKQDPDFELVSEPELCLLTYRYVPKPVKDYMATCNQEEREIINELLNDLTKFIQKKQRESGKSFVSRTRLTPKAHNGQTITVFRCVLANPLTTKEILQDILAEQKEIAKDSWRSLPAILKKVGLTA